MWHLKLESTFARTVSTDFSCKGAFLLRQITFCFVSGQYSASSELLQRLLHWRFLPFDITNIQDIALQESRLNFIDTEKLKYNE